MPNSTETRQLEVLVYVAQLIATLDLDEVLLQTLKLTIEVVGASKGSCFLLNEQGDALERFIAARDMDPHKKTLVSHQILEDGAAGWVIANNQAVIIADTALDKRWLVLDDPLRVRSAICVPFVVEGQVRGVMTLEHPEPNHFSTDDLRLTNAVASQAAVALRNAQLFERVQLHQRQLSAVLDSISECLLAVDHKWRLRLLNPAAALLFGVTATEAIGQRLDEVSDTPIVAHLTKMISEAQLTDGRATFELSDDSTRRDYVVNLATLRQDAASPDGYAIALYDVSSLKDLSRLKTHMLKMASHDLKTPLGLLLGYIDLVWFEVGKGNVPDMAYIESIYKAITRMETLIASLLDAHGSDEDTIVSVPIDPYELVQTVLEDSLPSAQQHQQHIIRNFQRNLHPIKGDPVQLREAMNNLFGNAIKYTPDEGSLTINVYTEEDRFYFSIKDTGYGVPEDQQPNIFQPNFRASMPATKHIEGTGVGLSLVKEVVERHGGQVWFLSNEGVGSTFGFWLPLLDSTVRS
ncbi:MAG: ATP-binding protein [Chloroflexota bacterium]